MSDLLDASVWVPLVATDHEHHGRARKYWYDEADPSIAFCRVTALAFLRHLTNPHIMQHAVVTNVTAWSVYEEWLRLPEICFLDEPATTHAQLGELSRSLPISSSLWTDAYLAAFALAGNHRIVTFDRDFQKFPGLQLVYLQG